MWLLDLTHARKQPGKRTGSSRARYMPDDQRDAHSPPSATKLKSPMMKLRAQDCGASLLLTNLRQSFCSTLG
eukprot:4869708-Pyramimonas_sp.AAC.1